jgi:hypothetical protein
MKISLDVIHSREAGYAAAMFDALQDAMEDDPAPEVVTKTETSSVDGLAQSVTTTTTEGGAQPSEAAATRRRGGRKSQAQKDSEAALLAAKGESALRPGDALRGVSAQTLAKALDAMPLVFEDDGVQMRVAPGTSQEEIEATRARLQAQSEAINIENEIAAKKEADAKKAADAKKEADAAKDKADAAKAEEAAKQSSGRSDMDDDLAALFRKAAPAPTPAVGAAQFAGMDRKALMDSFMSYLNTAGLPWARGVMLRFNIDALDDLSEDHIREVLSNPEIVKLPT